jgi:hypothetical protein
MRKSQPIGASTVMAMPNINPTICLKVVMQNLLFFANTQINCLPKYAYFD